MLTGKTLIRGKPLSTYLFINLSVFSRKYYIPFQTQELSFYEFEGCQFDADRVLLYGVDGSDYLDLFH